MNYDEAMAWAIEHNAVTRYYDEADLKMVRITVEDPSDPDERITVRSPLPVGIDAQKKMIATTITDIAGEFTHMDRRKTFRLVVA